MDGSLAHCSTAVTDMSNTEKLHASSLIGRNPLDIRMVFARLKHARALGLKRDLFDVPGSSEKIANVKSGTLYIYYYIWNLSNKNEEIEAFKLFLSRLREVDIKRYFC